MNSLISWKADEHLVNRILAELNVPIKRLVTDHRHVKVGNTFLAYAGDRYDARSDIARVIAAGANAVIWEKQQFSWNPEWVIPNCAVLDLKEKAGLIASRVYGNPSRHLWLVGFTGTNGKTSCSHWYAEAMTMLGKKTAVIGTLGNGFLQDLKYTANTTPDAVLLQETLASCLREGAQNLAIEVSSHGLVQGRVNGCEFAVAVLTNLSRDHLDYHKNMDEYAAAKAKLFFWPNLKCTVLNLDDVFGVELVQQIGKRDLQIIGYGFNQSIDLKLNQSNLRILSGSNLQTTINGLEFDVEFEHEKAHIKTTLLSRFNANNLLAVVTSLIASGVNFQDAVSVLSRLKPVPGRMEKFGGGAQPTVIVDYAHTPDALEKVLTGLRETLVSSHLKQRSHSRKARLICVFGCGGDRDRGKRPIAGDIVTRLADQVIVTSDNPRSEEARDIINEIVVGARSQNYIIEEDRASAIYQAIHNAHKNDIVLIAGKGAEAYQEIKDERLPFDDREVTQQVLHDLANMKMRARR